MADSLLGPSRPADIDRSEHGQAAVRAAIIESAKDLSSDELFLIDATFKKWARAGGSSPRTIAHLRPVHVSVAAFAKHAKVDALTAKKRLEAASDRLFHRSCTAVLDDAKNAGVELRFRWIDSRAVGDSYVKFGWTSIFATEFARALDAAKSAGAKQVQLTFLSQS